MFFTSESNSFFRESTNEWVIELTITSEDVVTFTTRFVGDTFENALCYLKDNIADTIDEFISILEQNQVETI